MGSIPLIVRLRGAFFEQQCPSLNQAFLANNGCKTNKLIHAECGEGAFLSSKDIYAWFLNPDS